MTNNVVAGLYFAIFSGYYHGDRTNSEWNSRLRYSGHNLLGGGLNPTPLKNMSESQLE